jgi:tRNA threonylcarbamoyladenosine biosynthesis protein TsaB
LETILALESSQLSASVVILRDRNVVASRTGSVAVAHSEALLPLLDGALGDAGIDLRAVDLFAAGVGPGSFTGIRIGCATIKALAQVMQKPILPVSSLRALALSPEVATDANVVAMANAYQAQVFVGWNESGSWREDAMPPSVWCSSHGKTANLSESLVFCGNGAAVYWNEIEKTMGAAKRIDEPQFATPVGVARAVIEAVALSPDRRVQYSGLHANYLRPSQAEMKLAAVIAQR